MQGNETIGFESGDWGGCYLLGPTNVIQTVEFIRFVEKVNFIKN